MLTLAAKTCSWSTRETRRGGHGAAAEVHLAAQRTLLFHQALQAGVIAVSLGLVDVPIQLYETTFTPPALELFEISPERLFAGRMRSAGEPCRLIGAFYHEPRDE